MFQGGRPAVSFHLLGPCPCLIYDGGGAAMTARVALYIKQLGCFSRAGSLGVLYVSAGGFEFIFDTSVRSSTFTSVVGCMLALV